jgi:putative transposase
MTKKSTVKIKSAPNNIITKKPTVKIKANSNNNINNLLTNVDQNILNNGSQPLNNNLNNVDNKAKPLGTTNGDTCFWFDHKVKTLSSNLFFPSSHNIKLIKNNKIQTPFPSNIMSFNQDVSKHIQFTDLSSLQPNYISTEIKNKFIKNLIKLIAKNINNKFPIINSISALLNNLINPKIKISDDIIQKILTILSNNNDRILKLQEANKIARQKKYIENKKNNIINNTVKAKVIHTVDDKIMKKYNKYLKKLKYSNYVLRADKHEIKLNDSQHYIIKNWIKICNHFYNFCVTKYQEYNNTVNKNKNSIYSFTQPYKFIKAAIFEDYFKNYLVSSNPEVIKHQININPTIKPNPDINNSFKYKTGFNVLQYNNNIKSDSKPIPYDMITDELRIFCSNLKSCRTNLKNKNQKHYTIKHQEYIRNSRSILLPKLSITDKGLFPTILGKSKFFNKKVIELVNQNKVASDSRLIYDYVLRKVFLIIPLYKPKKYDSKNKEKFIALDPGVRIFQTYYGEKSCGTIGEDANLLYKKINDKIEKLKGILINNKNRCGEKLKNRKSIKKKIYKLRNKLKDKIMDLRNKGANYICKNYERILLPSFEVSQMVKKEKDLNKMTKREMLSLSHYKFKQHIQHKSEEYGCKIEIVDEAYTSKCCGKCGILSKTYVNRVKKCPSCKVEINRDINGSYNILLKNVKKL